MSKRLLCSGIVILTSCVVLISFAAISTAVSMDMPIPFSDTPPDDNPPGGGCDHICYQCQALWYPGTGEIVIFCVEREVGPGGCNCETDFYTECHISNICD